jgi:hypothetical protein
LAFTLVMYFSFSTIDRGDDDKSMNEIFQYLTPGIAVVALFLSFKRYNKSTANLVAENNLPLKLGQYKIHYITHLALLEAAGLFATISFFSTGVFWYLLISVAMAAVIAMVRPTKEKIVLDLQLNHKEKMMIDDPDAIVAVVRVTN